MIKGLSTEHWRGLDKGELKNENNKRTKKSPYDEVKDKIIEYIELREQLYKRDKCELSWTVLKHKALCFAKNSGHNGFKAGESNV
jgi:hypothetical protein